MSKKKNEMLYCHFLKSDKNMKSIPSSIKEKKEKEITESVSVETLNENKTDIIKNEGNFLRNANENSNENPEKLKIDEEKSIKTEELETKTEIKINKKENKLKKIFQKLKNLSTKENFFKSSLKNIFSKLSSKFSKISKYEFCLKDQQDEFLDIIKTILKNLFTFHPEKETILILHYLDILNIFSLDEIIPIVGMFENCAFLSRLHELIESEFRKPTVDYQYVIKKKEIDIENKKEEINQFHLIHHQIQNIPDNYEPNIFKAVKECNLQSIQYLIEKQNIDVNITEGSMKSGTALLYLLETPLHYA